MSYYQSSSNNSSSPRGYMMQSNTTARMGLNMLTQPPSSQDPVASFSEDRRRPLPISSQYASSGSRHGSNASAATSGGWGSVSGSVSSASSGRSGSRGERILLLLLSELFEPLCELLDLLHADGVVVADSATTNAAVTLASEE
ncbi:hypothetical protein D6C87_00312 [Aureobasidium pullulans]|nr:hypothetical protein D6C87_00312 [Aureobasidium pullulans]